MPPFSFYFAVTNLYAVVFRIINGFVTWQVLGYTAVGLIGCFIGDFVGKKVFSKLDGKRVKRIIYIAMIVSGIIMIVNNL